MKYTSIVMYSFWALAFSLFSVYSAFGGDYIWLEGETPAAISSRTGVNDAWANEIFAGGKWLHVSIEADKVKTDVPDSGLVLTYRFNVEKPGRYAFWNRIGFEFVRSPFDWRIVDQAQAGQTGPNDAWQTVSPDQLTTDLYEVGFWCEVAWLKVSDVELSAGEKQLEIRLPRRFKTPDDEKNGKFDRILYASDAICLYPTTAAATAANTLTANTLTAGDFTPNGKYKPDEEYRTDRDKKATEHNFSMAKFGESIGRSSIALEGDWEICRADEQTPGPVAEPIPASALPTKNVRWSAIPVPSDKNKARPDLKFAHRVWYRTRVIIPEGSENRGYFLEFPQNNLNTTVYVNGQLCGFNKNPFARFQIDVTSAIKPGVNEILVGIRDAWYGRRADTNDPMVLRKTFNYPSELFSKGFQDFVYPIWNHPQSGILVTPTLTQTVDPVYVSDVFVKPSVKNQRLDVEITVLNPTDKSVKRTVSWKVGEPFVKIARCSSRPVEIVIPARSSKTFNLAEAWANPKLWKPQTQNANLYILSVFAKSGANKYTDIATINFGFREWSIQGKDFLLNGKPYPVWADCFTAQSSEDWLKFYRKTNQRVMRFWGTSWQGLTPEDALAFFDKNGVLVRRSGIFDGEAIGYNVIKDGKINTELFQNWRDQFVAQVKGERNHPSVMIWSMENEVLYINCINLYGGFMDQFEAETAKTAQAVQAVDPTRPVMVDGGGACKSNALPVHGDHYIFADYPKYPDQAYQSYPNGGGRNRWEWDQTRPRFIGEDFFANGINPFDYAWIGGEETFQGKAATRNAAGKIYRMLTEGYRWAGYGGWQFWMSQNEAVDQYQSNAPIAVFCKEYDWTFQSGSKVKRTLKVFNNGVEDEKLFVFWNWTTSKAQSPFREFNLKSGESQEFEIELNVPKTTAPRTEVRLKLAVDAERGGENDSCFVDYKDVSILNVTNLNVTNLNVSAPTVASGRLLVFDPKESVVGYLKGRQILFTVVQDLQDLNALPESGKTLLVGKDALTPELAKSPVFQKFTQQGRAVIVLEQQTPLCDQALPGQVQLAQNEGRIAFMENESHPIFNGLRQKDFFTWNSRGTANSASSQASSQALNPAASHVVYRNAYQKPERGARSLVQCDNRLGNSALLEFSAGSGVLLVSQMLIGEKLEGNPAAQQLLLNMIQYADQYKQTFVESFLFDRDADPLLIRELDALHLKYSRTSDLAAAVHKAQQSGGIVIVPASQRNLANLESQADRRSKESPKAAILLHNLTPDGLDTFNRLVKTDHLIREFRRERVLFPPKKHPLTEGLTLGDITMRSGERIFGWTSDEYVASDIFSYVVDLEDVAPFAARCFEVEQLTNGMYSADGWKYIHNYDALDKAPDDRLVFRFPREVELVGGEWVGNTFYYPVTRFGLFFDGKKDACVEFPVEPINDPQTFAIPQPIRGKELTIRLADWTVLPDKRQVTGLDNIRLFQKRPESYYKTVKPLLNIGALVEYQLPGQSVLLCNLKFQEKEAVPENGAKKRTILGTILRNLNAEFGVEDK